MLALSDATRSGLEKLGVGPTVDDERRALQRFVEVVRNRYGEQLEEAHLFGSRARGDARADSDADVALVFSAIPEPMWVRLRDLSAMSFDVLLDDGLHIQPHPILSSAWRSDAADAFVSEIRRKTRRLA